MKKMSFFETEEDECIIPRLNAYSPPNILDGIHKNIIPLYNLIMSKNNSKVELAATDTTTKNEYEMKTVSYPNIPFLHNYKLYSNVQ